MSQQNQQKNGSPKQANQNPDRRKLVAGVVVAVQAGGYAEVSVKSEDGGVPGERVVIRPQFHCRPIADSEEKYGIQLGDFSGPRPVKVGDHVYLIRHKKFTGVAAAWCYENDKVKGGKPQAKSVPDVPATAVTVPPTAPVAVPDDQSARAEKPVLTSGSTGDSNALAEFEAEIASFHRHEGGGRHQHRGQKKHRRDRWHA